MRRATLLAVVVLLTVAVPARAHPVSVHRATAAIRADAFANPTGSGMRVLWCHEHRPWGTLCETATPDCYTDATFGPASITFRNLMWVSRTRGKFSVVTVGWPPVTVTAPPPPGLCGQP